MTKTVEQISVSTPNRVLQPEGWARPIGYSNGMEARGRTVFVGGQIGWNAQCKFEAKDLPGQVRQTLENILAILREGGAGPEHVTTMTWYVLDRKQYSAALKEIGAAYKATMGRHFPAMAVVQVSGLIEDEALVEIQATAVVPD
ncbi:enamine deaminase RidA (YjgF/YER057c/UK114 family) [Phyllobacterium ifriqiyense]|uniref:Enamine deaminase RidA (YjgF/YER057c/UK114 family) n=1 Tax=Phyllobacterium ifriqiyense TaxID=314238 RepID=A0ABU0S2M4_9HYPH|nr:RidA family protein [Phyllobacterium ifriqiyense]MDQ0995002.1 enamine deaminase RidA (YjgF/YER057c/UK114 family) [Phyllobacterium ifriqiyense]